MVSWKIAATASLVALFSLETAEGLRLRWPFPRPRPSPSDPEVVPAEEQLIDVKELEAVDIINATGRLKRRPGDFYVVFTHWDGRSEVRRRGRSMPFHVLDIDSDGDPDDVAWVGIPFDATEEGVKYPLQCEVKRKRWLLRDRTVLTAAVNLATVLEDDDGIVQVSLQDRDGASTQSVLTLRFFMEQYVAGTLGGVKPEINADFFYRFFMWGFHQVAGSISTFIKDIVGPTAPADPELKTVPILDDLVRYPKDDEHFPLSFSQRMLLWFTLRLRYTNRNNPVDDRAYLRNQIRTKKLLGYVVKPPEGRWNAPLSDESMSRIFFDSFGMFYTKKSDNHILDHYGSKHHYVANFTDFSVDNMGYKPGLESLGCNVFFDIQGNITMIEDDDGTFYDPEDDKWGWAKLKARSAAFIAVSSEHLMDYHLFWGNIPAMAMRKFVSPDHDFRVAFSTHFFKTHRTCANSYYTLVAETSSIARVVPFSYDGGYLDFLKNLSRRVKFITYPEELKARGLDDCPFHIGQSDGLALREVLVTYVSNLLDELYFTEEELQEDQEVKDMYGYMINNMAGAPEVFSLDNLKLVFGEILFRVTGMHQSVGNAAVYAHEPLMINFRMKQGDYEVKGNWETMNVVAVITGRTQPNHYPKISSDWAGLLPWHKSKAYANLRSNLTQVGEAIDERNKERRFVNMDFHPDVAAISILS